MLIIFECFFYDFTETKQKAVIRVLQLRANVEDYGNGVLSDTDMAPTLEMIRSAKQTLLRGKTDLKKMKADGASRAELRQAKADNEETEIAAALLDELERFETPAGKARLDWAAGVAERGLSGIYAVTAQALRQAKALPNGTKEEREERKQAIADARLALRSRKAAEKYFPQGLTQVREQELQSLFEKEASLNEQRRALLANGGAKSELKQLSAKQKELNKQIKTATVRYQHFTESTKVYTEAKKYLAQAACYEKFGALHSRMQED